MTTPATSPVFEWSGEAVLSDCDGVLVDSIAVVDVAWTRWADHYRVDPALVLSVIHGRRAEESIALLAPQLWHPDAAAGAGPGGVDAADAFTAIEDLEVATSLDVAAMPGAHDLAASLGDRAWAIVTSATLRLAATRLGAAGVRAPAVVVTADRVANGKPAPDPYLLGARELGATPARCLVFEDAASGIRAGKAAGAFVVALRTSFPEAQLRDAGADAVIDDLRSVRVVAAEAGAIRLALAL